jgi:hypothetical protein
MRRPASATADPEPSAAAQPAGSSLLPPFAIVLPHAAAAPPAGGVDARQSGRREPEVRGSATQATDPARRNERRSGNRANQSP